MSAENNIVWHYSPQLAFCPAYSFIIQGYADMVKNKLTHPCLEFTNQSKVLYALDGDRVVAAQMYATDRLGRVFTHFTYVDAEYRGRGLAVEMFAELEKQARLEFGSELKAIYTSTVEENASMRRVLAKTGRNAFTVRSAKFYTPE